MRKTYFLNPLVTIVLLIAGLSTTLAQNAVKPTVKAPNGFDVNSYTGNLYHQRTDMKMPAQGLPMEIVFSYNNTQRNKNWGYGPGWTFTYNVAYTVDSVGNITVLRADGRRDVFRKVGAAYKAPTGAYDTLAEYQAGKFRLNTRGGWTYYFDIASHRKLTKVQDRNNNTITISYADSLPSAITDAAGRTFVFTWDNGKLKEIQNTCSAPVRKIVYSYDTFGNPIKVMRPDSSTLQYYYDDNSRIIGHTDELANNMSITYNGNGAVSKIVSCATTQLFTYSPQTRKTFVTEQVQGQRQITTYTYDTTGRIMHKEGNCCGYNLAYQYDSSNNVSALTNGNNQTTQYVYDAKGNVIKETDAEGYSKSYTWHPTLNRVLTVKDKRGNITSYEYDAAGNQTKVIKPLGITEVYTYDSKGNVLTLKDGNSHITTNEYNAYDLLTKTTDALNGIVTYTYDGCGNLAQVKDARNNVTSYEYDLQNRVTKVTDALGGITKYTYDPSGNLSSQTNALNHTTTYLYDGLGRRIKATSPSGHTQTEEYDEHGNRSKVTDARGNSTSYTYNSRNQVLTERDALGKTKSFDYDGAGNLVSETDKKGNTTRYEYDKLNRLIKTIDAGGFITTNAYDGNGNKTATTDNNGNITYYVYDELNRQVQVTDPYNKTIAYTYDGNGNMLTRKDKNGKTWSKTYDALNREIKSTNPLGFYSEATYDGNGNMLTSKNELGEVTTSTYDALNRKLTETNALNEATVRTYDLAGNLKTMVTPNGNTRNYSYDNEHQLTSISDAIGLEITYTYDANGNRVTVTDGNNHTETTQYDELNRPKAITDAIGNTSFKQYDANNNLIKQTDRNNNSSSFEYDALNRVIREIDALGNNTRFKFDGNGNRVRVTDAKNNITSYNYDALDRLIRETYAEGSRKEYSYDGNSNRKARKDNNGETTTYQYDDANRLIQRSFPGGQNETFTYSAIGQSLTANNSNASITFTYDHAGRVLTETVNGKTTGYAYNTAARTRTFTYPGGRVVKETWDQRDRLTTVSEGAITLAQFSYDAAGRLTSKTLGNGVVQNYAYDANNRLTSLDCQPNNALSFQYSYDKEGNRLTALKGHRPTYSEKYAYDNLYQLTGFYTGRLSGAALSDTTSRNSYSYDALHNRIVSLEDNQSRAYFTNNINAYTGISTNGITTNYTLDKNGNILNDGQYTYKYDTENSLTEITGFSRYLFDALGRKTKTIRPTDTIQHFYIGTHITEEQNSSGQTTKTFVFGGNTDELISYSKNGIFYACGDLQNNTNIIFENATIKERYDYSGFGQTQFFNAAYQSIAGSLVNNDITWQGRNYLNTQLYYFRSRNYSASAGRFYSLDPIEYVNGYNLYAFTGNSPANHTDNLGMWFLEEGSGADVLLKLYAAILAKFPFLGTTHYYTTDPNVVCNRPPKGEGDCDQNGKSKKIQCNQEGVFEFMRIKKKYMAPTLPAYSEQGFDDKVTYLIGPNMIEVLQGLEDIISKDEWSLGLLLGEITARHIFNISGTGNPITLSQSGPLTIKNTTLFPHILYPGFVTRTITQDDDHVYVTTHGEGLSLAPAIGLVNDFVGPRMFKYIVDANLIREFNIEYKKQ